MADSFTRTATADTAALPGLIEDIETWLEGAGLPMAEAARLMIALDEILSNIAKYGEGTMRIAIQIDGNRIDASISDDGPRFDPLARAVPDTGLDIDDRAIGGLGIHLVRELMDHVAYSYENGLNRLTFGKTF